MDSARDSIRGRLHEAKAFLSQEAAPWLSESDTRAHFIDPILAALGWHGIGTVTREYHVRSSKEYIDYVMTDAQKHILAIEAKQLQTKLTDQHAAQLVQYCAVEGIEWAALTNGRELQFFNTFLRPDLAAKRLFQLDLLESGSDAEFDVVLRELWRLSREELTSPAGTRAWLSERRLTTAIGAILRNQDSPTILQLRHDLAGLDVNASQQSLTQWFGRHLQMADLPTASASTNDLVQRQAKNPYTRHTRTSGEFDQASPDEVQPNRVVDLSALLKVLQGAVEERLPDAIWRETQQYFAAASNGHTFMAVRERRDRLIVGLTLPKTTSGPRIEVNSGKFPWGRITKLVTLRDSTEIDDELLAVVESARSHAIHHTSARSHIGISLLSLVEAGIVPEKARLVLLGPRNREVARANLTAEGEIRFNGHTYTSPSDKEFARLLGRTSVNGWAQWHVELPEGRKSLASVRDALLASQSARHE